MSKPRHKEIIIDGNDFECLKAFRETLLTSVKSAKHRHDFELKRVEVFDEIMQKIEKKFQPVSGESPPQDT